MSLALASCIIDLRHLYMTAVTGVLSNGTRYRKYNRMMWQNSVCEHIWGLYIYQRNEFRETFQFWLLFTVACSKES